MPRFEVPGMEGMGSGDGREILRDFGPAAEDFKIRGRGIQNTINDYNPSETMEQYSINKDFEAGESYGTQLKDPKKITKEYARAVVEKQTASAVTDRLNQARTSGSNRVGADGATNTNAPKTAAVDPTGAAPGESLKSKASNMLQSNGLVKYLKEDMNIVSRHGRRLVNQYDGTDSGRIKALEETGGNIEEINKIKADGKLGKIGGDFLGEFGHGSKLGGAAKAGAYIAGASMLADFLNPFDDDDGRDR